MQHFKTLNDPIYGFVEIPEGLISDLIEHPYYQRLRRVAQLGMAQYVYTGATHSRFGHTLGALHLMQQAVAILQRKGVEISEEETEAVCIAILLHDLGHSPFSHSLEHTLLKMEHEIVSLALMEELNQQFGKKLSLPISIFKNEYPKKFLHQLVSGQLDMDRLDYLNRDSYYTGVSDGKVGSERIIKMLNVVDNELVVEFKGIYSIEKFLIARRLMYWQVYLHKAVVCASQMLCKIIERARWLSKNKGENWQNLSPNLVFFIKNEVEESDLDKNVLEKFAALDDSDILSALKSFAQHPDKVISLLSDGLLKRKLLKIEVQDHSFKSDFIKATRLTVVQQLGIDGEDADFLVFGGTQTNKAYDASKQQIFILLNDNKVKPISEWREHNIQPKEVKKYFFCCPKL